MQPEAESYDLIWKANDEEILFCPLWVQVRPPQLRITSAKSWNMRLLLVLDQMWAYCRSLADLPQSRAGIGMACYNIRGTEYYHGCCHGCPLWISFISGNAESSNSNLSHHRHYRRCHCRQRFEACGLGEPCFQVGEPLKSHCQVSL